MYEILIRLFDLFFSFIAILILIPFMIPIMIGLKLTGEHYIFYLQPRVGKNGKEFKMIKFATMLKDSPNLPGGDLTQKNDPRILPMGKFLRKTKINELPQLVNILIGQMSFVGPRPMTIKHHNIYKKEIREAIESVLPGLTGIASVVFRDEESLLNEIGTDRTSFHHDIITPFKGELEVWWTRHRTLRNYFKLIILTAWALVSPRTKLWKSWFHDLPKVPNELEKYL